MVFVLLNDLVTTSKGVAEVSGRLEKIARLAVLLRRFAPDEVGIGVAFLSGRLTQGRIGIGPAVAWETRQAGSAAAASSLTLGEVDDAFGQIGRKSGRGTAADKARLLADLFRRATAEEQDFLARLLLGELRQGALEGLLVEALARAAGVSRELVRRAAMMAGDPGRVAKAALFEGEAALSRFAVQLFRPVKPMLADTAEDVDGALERLGEAALEYKLDGARIQVHKAGEDVKVFSRHLREVTPAVPEIVGIVRALPARELILDGEVIALRDDQTPHPFQVTMRRFGRKLDVGLLARQLPLTPFFFDCLFLDGQSLIDEPQSRRAGELAGVASATLLVPRIVTASPQRAESFLDEALRRGHEGVMVKSLAAGYEAGSRGQAWLKIKAAHTLDLVVLAAEWGHGRRTGWLSNLHLGARDAERAGFVMLGKTFKGLTDEMLAWQTRKLLELEIGRDEYTVHVRPDLVVEVAFNDVQASPQYPGGLALRFARVKRFRPEKPASEADTLAAVQAIFRRATGQDPSAA